MDAEKGKLLERFLWLLVIVVAAGLVNAWVWRPLFNRIVGMIPTRAAA